MDLRAALQRRRGKQKTRALRRRMGPFAERNDGISVSALPRRSVALQRQPSPLSSESTPGSSEEPSLAFHQQQPAHCRRSSPPSSCFLAFSLKQQLRKEREGSSSPCCRVGSLSTFQLKFPSFFLSSSSLGRRRERKEGRKEARSNRARSLSLSPRAACVCKKCIIST